MAPEDVADPVGVRRRILGRNPLLGALPGEDLDRLAMVARLHAVDHSTMLFRKGDPGDVLYLVVDGAVRIGTVSADGRETVLNLIGPNQIFGEVATFDGGGRIADAVTIGPAALLLMERRDVIAVFERNPQCFMALLAACAARARWINELLEDAQFLELPARLAKRLLCLADTFGKDNGDGVLIDLRLSQQELAHHMNVSRESVNKLLVVWQDRGWIGRDRGLLVLRDPGALTRLLIDGRSCRGGAGGL